MYKEDVDVPPKGCSDMVERNKLSNGNDAARVSCEVCHSSSKLQLLWDTVAHFRKEKQWVYDDFDKGCAKGVGMKLLIAVASSCSSHASSGPLIIRFLHAFFRQKQERANVVMLHVHTCTCTTWPLTSLRRTGLFLLLFVALCGGERGRRLLAFIELLWSVAYILVRS